MFNAEKLLGGMLKESIGIKGFSRKAVIGGGLLGLAFAAAEHFMNKSQTPFSGGGISAGNAGAGSPSPSLPGAGTPPPVPHAASTAVPPPPPPGAGISSPPPPPAGAAQPPSSEGNKDQQAVLLIRAMIASAAADGQIDEQEKHNIISKLESVDLSEEERDFIHKELASPCGLETITRQVSTPELARQVYTVSLMAVEVDTDAERNYLNTLAERLGLDQAVKDQIHEELGISYLVKE